MLVALLLDHRADPNVSCQYSYVPVLVRNWHVLARTGTCAVYVGVGAVLYQYWQHYQYWQLLRTSTCQS